jgi:hypothetical protein
MSSKAMIERATEKPQAIPVAAEAIPACLRERRQWVCWQYRRREDKWTKFPIDAETGAAAKSTDPRTWSDFATAWERYRSFRSTTDGIGYVFAADDPFTGIDLDDARDSRSGQLAEWALNIVNGFKTYTELSPSGTGVKIFAEGKKPGEKCKTDKNGAKIELYDTGRYFAVTGQHLVGTPATVEARQEGITSLYHRLFSEAGTAHTSAMPDNLDDQELIRRASEAANGAKFRELWAGNVSAYDNDDSRADLALCGLLAFWTGGDAARIDRLFRLSGLMRPKWEREDYRRRTIDTALEGKTEFYGGKPKAEPHSDASPADDIPVNPWPDPLADAAYHGLAGDIVRAIEPHSEADPVALLVQLLVSFGAALGRTAHFLAESDTHYLNEFALLIGKTSKARKGTSWGRIRRLVEIAEPEFAKNRILGGLSSGEGLIWACRDPITKRSPVKERGRITGYQEVQEDPGISDKRLLCYESEFASVLRRIEGQQGNTLSALLRQAWETGDLRTLTKNSPVKATGAHVSLICHVTIEDLLRYLSATEQANGFGNRFAPFCVRRSKQLPEGGAVPQADLDTLGYHLGKAVNFGRAMGELRRDDQARSIWRTVYGPLSEGKPGLAGSMLARAEAHVMRFACLYAVLDCSEVVGVEHLKAALALWDFAEASVQWAFGDSLGDPLADELLRFLRAAGTTGVTRTEIRDFLGRNQSADRIGRALGLLFEAKKARREIEKSDRRDIERWFALGR